MQPDQDHETILTHTADIVSAHVANNSVGADEVPSLISSVYAALTALAAGPAPAPEPLEPAVSIRSSVKPSHITCLDCGKQMKMLKRHLSTDHGLTPDAYRERWNLPANYPLVCTDYADTRRELAKKIGLGRTPGQKRGRRRKA